jgi:diaminopimelate epimerase
MNGIIYDGAGNLFRMTDGRAGLPVSYYTADKVQELCSLPDGRKTDGLIVLTDTDAEGCLFEMHYFNNDGSGGVMCGNGGRCAVSFAMDLGLISPGGHCRFISNGKQYEGTVIMDEGCDKTVRLDMPDVFIARTVPGLPGWLVDTGCPHFVRFLKEGERLEGLDIDNQAKPLRFHEAFAPGGVNVNFVSASDDVCSIRSYERGVEAETLACGTGIVAAAIAIALQNGETGELHYDFKALGGPLSVDLTHPAVHPDGAPVATGIRLTGPTHRH